MNSRLPSRRLIVNADDFGRSPSINAAVLRAHKEGILTSASLMVNEPAAEEAIALAKAHPHLGVGLHLVLVMGRAALAPEKIPGLVHAQGEFSNNPVTAGMKFFFCRSLRAQIRDELDAQFARFRATGLPLDHVNGHLNIHLHPVVFSVLMENAERWGLRHLRLTDDPLRLNRQLASGKMFYRASHAFIYRQLARRARPELARCGIKHTARVFGLLQNARVDTAFVRALLAALPEGDSELYSHPSLDEFKPELDALVDPAVKPILAAENIRLIRYQDL